jgi:transcription elongation factor Elf1
MSQEKFYERTFICHECQVPLVIETVSFSQSGMVKFNLYCSHCKKYFSIIFKVEELMIDCFTMDRYLCVFDGGYGYGKKKIQ